MPKQILPDAADSPRRQRSILGFLSLLMPVAVGASWLFAGDVFTPVLVFVAAAGLTVAAIMEAAWRKKRFAMPLAALALDALVVMTYVGWMIYVVEPAGPKR